MRSPCRTRSLAIVISFMRSVRSSFLRTCRNLFSSKWNALSAAATASRSWLLRVLITEFTARRVFSTRVSECFGKMSFAENAVASLRACFDGGFVSHATAIGLKRAAHSITCFKLQFFLLSSAATLPSRSTAAKAVQAPASKPIIILNHQFALFLRKLWKKKEKKVIRFTLSRRACRATRSRTSFLSQSPGRKQSKAFCLPKGLCFQLSRK